VLTGTVPLLFLLLLLIVSLLLQSVNAQSSGAAHRSTELLRLSTNARALIDRAGQSIVQFERTGDRASLQAYRSAVTGIRATLAQIAAGANGDPIERADAARIVQTSTTALGVLAKYLGDVRRGRIAAAHAYASSPGVRALSTSMVAAYAAFEQHQLLVSEAIARRLRSQTATFSVLLVLLSLAGAVATLTFFLRFGTRITRRIEELGENARRLADDRPTEPIGGDDEIAELDRVYQQMARRIAREHDVATILQRALLPQDLPTLPGLRLDAAYVPAGAHARVGGDWYDIFRLSDRTVGISVGDVAGHGVRAAALMDCARQAIRTVASFDAEPSSVVRHVNRVVCANQTAPLVTAFFATLDLRDGKLRYCFAGHPAPIVVTAGGVQELLAGQGLVLGIAPDAEYETLERTLDVGTAMVLYTDGLIETNRDYDGGLRYLIESVEAEYRNASQNIAQAILSRALGTEPPRDDAALLFVGVTALGEAAVEPKVRTWKVDAREERSARRVKRAVLWHLGTMTGKSVDLSAAELIMTELIGNVAKHTPGMADVSLEWDGSGAIFRIADRGPRFEPRSGAPVVDVMSEGGRGLFLAGALAHGLRVEWSGEGNCVTAVLPVDGIDTLAS